MKALLVFPNLVDPASSIFWIDEGLQEYVVVEDPATAETRSILRKVPDFPHVTYVEMFERFQDYTPRPEHWLMVEVDDPRAALDEHRK